ncbi:TPA: hypothetical protein DIV49_01025 [Candidatus Saccharibacteria bacterium]|nr:hypothetical protein [Candidatus Saccharibacteria bacterium]
MMRVRFSPPAPYEEDLLVFFIWYVPELISHQRAKRARCEVDSEEQGRKVYFSECDEDIFIFSSP